VALHLPTSTDRSTEPGSSESDDRRHGKVDDDRRITLDADVPPSPLVSGVSGLSELSTINRAIGVLIGHGHHPDHAGDTLRRRAASREDLEPHRHAARLLGRPEPDRHTGPRRQAVTPADNNRCRGNRPLLNTGRFIGWIKGWSTTIPKG
jgi:hypothetical protein